MDDRPTGSADDGVIFAAIYPGLRRFASVVGWPEHDPDDLVQEAVARALRHGPIGALDNPGAYLRTTVLRLVANRSRGRGRRSVVHRSLAAAASDGVDAYPRPASWLRVTLGVWVAVADPSTGRPSGYVTGEISVPMTERSFADAVVLALAADFARK